MLPHSNHQIPLQLIRSQLINNSKMHVNDVSLKSLFNLITCIKSNQKLHLHQVFTETKASKINYIYIYFEKLFPTLDHSRGTENDP